MLYTYLTHKKTTSAKLEIEKEDSGGRYYRIVNWEKEVRGKNWQGTMAYANSIFGDGEKSAIPNQFLACPKPALNPCFYIHITTPTKLSKRDLSQIINTMKDISINHKKKRGVDLFFTPHIS